jgi:histidine kinase 2/3/4 (cytokinin receptor)
VRDFLNDLMALFEDQCKFKNIELQNFVDKRIPSIISADPKRIKQILMNLISNSLKFTNKGHIKVSIELDEDIQPLSRVRLPVSP